uniref:Uncharacterized protein n=1 Tax=Lepeophtheirus salmonis TaxID=72036 RepID=A0A0K2VGT9_LEPSM
MYYTRFLTFLLASLIGVGLM